MFPNLDIYLFTAKGWTVHFLREMITTVLNFIFAQVFEVKVWSEQTLLTTEDCQ